jgi:hypothetical protein
MVRGGLDVANQNRASGGGKKMFLTCPYIDQAITVRRERRWSTARRKTRPGTGSLHPVAIGAAVEATKPPEPPV